MKTIIVTGITSFIGYHLSLFFAGEGYRVIGTTTGGKGRGDDIASSRLARAGAGRIEIETLDITDSASVEAFIAHHRPDFWIHHGGWAKDYRNIHFDLHRAFAINVLPLAAVFAALHKAACRGIIVTGTESEYSESNEAHREDEPCMPTTSYGLSKLSETIHSRQLSLHYGVPARVTRLFIPYGPFDAPHKVIASTVKALRENRPIDLSCCTQTRDFLHVDDVVRGYGALIEDMENRGETFDLFNICSGREVPLKDVLASIAGALGSDMGLLHFGMLAFPSGEGPVCYGDNSKALKFLKWKPLPLEEGISRYLSTSENHE